MVYGWKENSMLINCLAACAHLPITVCKIERDICEKILILSYPLAFNAPVRGFPSECRYPLWYGKTRMVSLPDSEKNSDMFIRFDVIHRRDRRTDMHLIVMSFVHDCIRLSTIRQKCFNKTSVYWLGSEWCRLCHVEQLDQLQTDLEENAGKLEEGGEVVNASGQS